jgi:hypothetical protein
VTSPNVGNGQQRRRQRRWPRAWRTPTNPIPWLKEYWYYSYVADHAEEFGLADIEGPFFDSGCDFKARIEGRTVSVEVERDYISYLAHGHPLFDVLIVGLLDDPHPDMQGLLPPVIKKLDPHKVADYTKPMRVAYGIAKEAERAQRPSVEDLRKAGDRVRGFADSADFLAAHLRGPVELVRVKEGWAAIASVEACKLCGGVMFDEPYDDEVYLSLSEGAQGNYDAGLESMYRCGSCGVTEFVNR